ncbi:glutamate 2,3-aminomutase [Clostridium aestuarii]|uniref:Glutamate 2,3-aminomutase n=1 Tax=Clostridium aestuarii TaxID=338193 RepID=A0ABT4D1V4_9CLOT|nr:glutamate 2,3-aminomutase [Clostridium aestuarii]
MNKRDISLKRAAELKSRIDDYLNIKDLIKKGTSVQQKENIAKMKETILEFFKATEDDWQDWKWQLKNRISDVDTLSKLLDLDEKEIENIKKVGENYRWAVSPYYLSLIDKDKFNPVRLQSIPTGLELDGEGEKDPMAEEFTNPAGSITRRYPDRLIINVTNECPMYCRHCQRRRNIGSVDSHKSKEILKESLEYIRNNPEIRDVLITGGDTLALSDNMIDWLLSELRSIPSVEIIRLGTRTLVTMPQRITDDLVNILKKYHPLFINTHFNHPLEITEESKAACEKLANAGIPLGNQAVLLNGINNDKYVMRLLNHELLKCRVRPYYIFHAKHVIGTTHFNTSIDDGIEIMEYLRGYTSGLAIPTYIVNAPNGKGKTPILPQYLLSRAKDSVKIRTWEGEVIDYPNHPTIDIKSLL